ncbi:MAG: DUF21 domain-containing protein [Sedimentisphaerales bacterium]|nr:DUF21 domain-containing protein [Sedimentisphaerales bacterium]
MLLSIEILLFLTLLVLSAFFSGSETGMYRLSRFRLRLGTQQHRPMYSLLAQTIGDGHGLMLSLLTGNNLVNCLATSLVTYMLIRQGDSQRAAEVHATMIMTPTLFLFGEILPKTLYYYRADTLMPRCASLLWLFHKLLVYSGIVVFLKAVTHVLNRLTGSRTDPSAALAASARHQVRQLLQETRDEGLLSPLQRQIMQYLVAAPDIQARELMIPLKQVAMVDVDTSRDALLQALEKIPFTRLPVFEDTQNNIIGHIHVCRVLASRERFSDLRSFVEPLHGVSETSSVLDMIHQMHTRRDRMVMVVASESVKPPVHVLGIVTIKDLAEELTGEIASA